MTAPVMPAHEAVCGLLAAAWDPQSLPAPESVPWPEALRLLVPGNAGAVVYAVTRPVRAALSADVELALGQAFYQTAAENTRGLQELAEVGSALARAGGPLMLLKGAAMADEVYADPALRPIGDIDLLVAPADVPACRKALLGLGYVPRQSGLGRGSLPGQSNQEQFGPPSGCSANVELHWHLLDVPYYLHHMPVGWFWEHSEQRTIAGQPFRVLTPEANLLYLPAHLALHHQFGGLHSYLDLVLLILKYQDRLNWAEIAAAAQSLELLSALRATLGRLSACWPALPLDEARRQVYACEPTATDARLFRLLSAEDRDSSRNIYTTLASLPGVAARLRYVWDNLLPQPVYMKRKYGVGAGWELPYWYLYRLAAGLVRFVRTLPGARRLDRGTG